jgi:hypothetical protein
MRMPRIGHEESQGETPVCRLAKTKLPGEAGSTKTRY